MKLTLASIAELIIIYLLITNVPALGYIWLGCVSILIGYTLIKRSLNHKSDLKTSYYEVKTPIALLTNIK